MERGIIKPGHRGSSRIGGWPGLHHGGGAGGCGGGSECVCVFWVRGPAWEGLCYHGHSVGDKK